MDLRKRLGEVLDQAAAGERVVIERDRRPLAVLVPFRDALAAEETEEQRRLRIDAAFESLRRFAARIAREYPAAVDAASAVRMDRDHAETSDNVRDHGR